MNEYPATSPYLLSQLEPDIPLDSEDVAVLAEALRQTRRLLKEAMLVSHNDDGTIKIGAVTIGAGTTNTAALADGAVSTAAKLAGGVVTDEKITGPITGSKVTNIPGTSIQSSASDDSVRAIGTDHIKDGAVTAAKLNGGITTAQIAPGSITKTLLAAGAVDNSNLGNDIQPSHIVVPSGQLLIGDANAAVARSVGGAITVASISPTEIIFALGSTASGANVATFQEVKDIDNKGAGALISRVFRPRNRSLSYNGVSYSGVGLTGSNTFVKATNDNDLEFQVSGSYLLIAFLPGYSCGAHMARLVDYTTPSAPVVKAYGSVGVSPAGVTTYSILAWASTLTVGTAKPTWRIEHASEHTQLETGMGLTAKPMKTLLAGSVATVPPHAIEDNPSSSYYGQIWVIAA